MMANSSNVQRWMDMLENNHTPEGLSELLADDAVMLSPIVHTPQKGKMITMAYLLAAGQTIGNDTFQYTRIFDCGERAVLEFETEMEGIHVNGVDMIEWNEAGQIAEYKVMVRPLKAVQVVHAKMGEMLEQLKSAQSS